MRAALQSDGETLSRNWTSLVYLHHKSSIMPKGPSVLLFSQRGQGKLQIANCDTVFHRQCVALRGERFEESFLSHQ